MQQRLDHEAANALPTTRREFTASTDKLAMIEKNKQGLEKAIGTLDKSKARFKTFYFKKVRLVPTN